MSICKRLVLGCAAMSALMLGMGYFSMGAIRELGDTLAVNSAAHKIALMGDLRSGFQEMIALAKGSQLAYALSHLEVSGHDAGLTAMRCADCHASAGIEDRERKFQVASERVLGEISELRPLLSRSGEAGTLASVEKGVRNWALLYRHHLELSEGGHFAEAHSLITEQMDPLLQAVDAAATRLQEQQRQYLQVTREGAGHTAAQGSWFALALMALSIGAVAFVVLMVRQTTQLLRSASAQIRQAAEQVAVIAEHVCLSSAELAQKAAEQASSLSLTSCCSEQVNFTAGKNMQSARVAASLSAEIEQRINNASAAVAEATTTMQEVGAAGVAMRKIVGVSDSIAMQTTMLALNAAVEAARAGDAGLGFAVVADEVRHLAQRAADGSRETESLIGNSVSKVTAGQACLRRAIEGLHGIAKDTNRARGMAIEVHMASEEQATGLSEMTKCFAEAQLKQRRRARPRALPLGNSLMPKLGRCGIL